MSQDEKKRLPISNEEKAPKKGRSVRERVIQRFHKLAPLAVIAAVPVMNTACDPAPEPYCTEASSVWVAEVKAEAVWVDAGGGNLRIELTLTVNHELLSLSGTYTAQGGTVDTTKDVTGGQVLDITPDAGVTEVTVSGSVDCEFDIGPFDVKLTWTGTPAAGDKVTATVTSTAVN